MISTTDRAGHFVHAASARTGCGTFWPMARKAKDRPADSQDARTPPDDPSRILLTYHHEHPWWYSADDAPERWHISADICDDSGHPEVHVGDIGIVIVDLNETRDPFSLLDVESADLGHIAGVVFGPGSSDLDPELDEQLEVFGGRLLILDTVRLTPSGAASAWECC